LTALPSLPSYLLKRFVRSGSVFGIAHNIFCLLSCVPLIEAGVCVPALFHAVSAIFYIEFESRLADDWAMMHNSCRYNTTSIDEFFAKSVHHCDTNNSSPQPNLVMKGWNSRRGASWLPPPRGQGKFFEHQNVEASRVAPRAKVLLDQASLITTWQLLACIPARVLFRSGRAFARSNGVTLEAPKSYS
jgi:hypothetical protein